MRNRALEQVIVERPDDDQAYIVYGDWLQEQGDPRGELIAIQQRLFHEPNNIALRCAEAELIHRKREQIFGPLAAHLDCSALKWHLGFVRSVRVLQGPSMQDAKAADLLGDLLQAECAAFLQELTLGQFDEELGEAQDLVDAMLACPLPQTLNSLFLFDTLGLDQRVDLSGLGEVAPQLHRLNLSAHDGAIRLGEIQLPALQQLSLLHGYDDAQRENIAVVSEPRFAELEALSLWWDDDNAVAALSPLFDGRLPKLRQLRLLGSGQSAELLEALLEAPLCQQLESLEVSVAWNLDTTAASRFIARGPNRLPRLEQLRLIGTGVDEHKQVAAAFRGVDVWVAERIRGQGGEVGYIQLLGRALGDPERAAAAAALLEQTAGAGVYLFNDGTYRLYDDENEAALRLLRLALELPQPSAHRQVWSNLGIACADLQRFDEAIEIARAGIVRFPYDTNLHAILIDALRHQRRLDEALAAVEVGRPTLADSVEGYCLAVDMMLTFLIAGRPAEAVALYEAVISGEALGDPYPGYIRRGKSEHERHRKRVKACGALAYVHNAQLDEAKEISRTLRVSSAHGRRAREGRDPILHHARACIAAKANRWAEARKQIEKARKMSYAELDFVAEDPLLDKL